MSINNYVSVGKTVECGSCYPEKFPGGEALLEKYGLKCECQCHSQKPVEGTCKFCDHGKCGYCKSCHNISCPDFLNPLNKCYNQLLPKKPVEEQKDSPQPPTVEAVKRVAMVDVKYAIESLRLDRGFREDEDYNSTLDDVLKLLEGLEK